MLCVTYSVHVITLSFDWFTELSVLCDWLVIILVLVLGHSIENCILYT